jgi:hypothetical protein
MQQVAQVPKAPQPTVKEQLEQGLGSLGTINPTVAQRPQVNPITPQGPMAQPQPQAPVGMVGPKPAIPQQEEPQMAHGGLASMPLHHMFHSDNFAAGGIVAFANGGDTEDDDLSPAEREAHEAALRALVSGNPDANQYEPVAAADKRYDVMPSIPLSEAARVKGVPVGPEATPTYGGNIVSDIASSIGNYFTKGPNRQISQDIVNALPELHDNSGEVLRQIGSGLYNLLPSMPKVTSPGRLDQTAKIQSVAQPAPQPVAQPAPSSAGLPNYDIPNSGFPADTTAPVVPSKPAQRTRPAAAPAKETPAPTEEVTKPTTHPSRIEGRTSMLDEDGNLVPLEDIKSPLTGRSKPAGAGSFAEELGNVKTEQAQAGIVADPMADVRNKMTATEARWAQEHKNDSIDRLLAQLGGIATADPQKGFGYAMAVGANASSNIEKEQRKQKDIQDKASLEFAALDAKEKDARARNDYAAVKSIQLQKDQKQQEFYKSIAEETKVVTEQQNAKTAADRVAEEVRAGKFNRTEKFQADQKLRNQELQIQLGQLGLAREKFKQEQEDRPFSKAARNLSLLETSTSKDRRLNDILGMLYGDSAKGIMPSLDPSKPEDWKKYSELAKEYNDIMKSHYDYVGMKTFHPISIPEKPAEPEPDFFSKLINGTPEKPATTVQKRPEGVPPGVNYKYSPSQDKYWWQDANGNWKSNK